MTRPTRLLTQNSELRPLGIHNWTIPAWVVRLTDGTGFNTCPAAGACKDLCYARNGTYRFSNVAAAHLRNLEHYLNDPATWAVDMLDELTLPRFKARPDRPHLPDYPRDHLTPRVAHLLDTGAPIVRIHDAGDFFSDAYALDWLAVAAQSPDVLDWLAVAAQSPDVLFYAYTKEVARFARLADRIPDNLLLCYSLGGREDHLLDLDVDRHADVFPGDTPEEAEARITAAGYESQEPHDLLCVVSVNHRVGIPANRIRHFVKRQGNDTFGTLEAAKVRHSRA